MCLDLLGHVQIKPADFLLMFCRPMLGKQESVVIAFVNFTRRDAFHFRR